MRLLSNKPLSLTSFLSALNREVVPAIRSLQLFARDIATSVVEDIQAELDALEAAIIAAQADVDAVEVSVAAVVLDVAAVEADVADHETRIGALEAAEASYKTTTYSGKLTSPGTSASTTYYWPLFGSGGGTTPGTTLSRAQHLWGRPGTIKNLRFNNMNALASPGTWSLTLNLDGVDQTLTLTGLATSTSTLQSDTTHSVTVAAGSKLCWKQVQDGSGNNVGSDPSWSFDFEEA